MSTDSFSTILSKILSFTSLGSNSMLLVVAPIEFGGGEDFQDLVAFCRIGEHAQHLQTGQHLLAQVREFCFLQFCVPIFIDPDNYGDFSSALILPPYHIGGISKTGILFSDTHLSRRGTRTRTFSALSNTRSKTSGRKISRGGFTPSWTMLLMSVPLNFCHSFL